MKKIAVIMLVLLGSISLASAQTGTIKLVSKKVAGPVEISPGVILNEGDQLELNEGLSADGYRHVYMVLNGQKRALDHSANYETVTVKEIWKAKKYDEYFVIVNWHTSTYIAEVDKGLRSGEIIQIIPKDGMD